MDITKESIGELSAVVNIKVTPNDYEPRVEQVLKDYQKKAVIPGFRQGKVPQGVIKKMFGKSVLAEELNKMLQDSLYDYLQSNKIAILGQPLPKDSNEFSPEEHKEFVFSYELGLAPSVEINFNSLPKIVKNEIGIDEDLVNKYVVDLSKKFGEYNEAELSENGDILYGELQQLDAEGNILESGAKNNTYISIDFITDESVRQNFIGLKKGDTLKFNPLTAIGNETEVSSMLGIEKTNSEGMQADYVFAIEKISRVKPSEINQELFDKAYGKDAISSEEQLKDKIRSEMTGAYETAVQNRLRYDIEKTMIENVNIGLPDDFLKRYITVANTDKLSAEDIERQYDSYALGLKWNLITNKISSENEIDLTEQELLDFTIRKHKKAFEKYGVFGAFDDYFVQMANKDLSDPEKLDKLRGELMEDKVFSLLESNLVSETKSVSLEDFKKL
jgi:trigger factor